MKMVQENEEYIEEIRQAIRLINEFKALGNRGFSRANLLFGWLIVCREGSLGDETLSVYIETNDPRGSGGGYGEYFDNEYFDLLVFTLNELSVCMPVPLVTDNKVLYRLMKVAEVVPRKKHNRVLPKSDTDIEKVEQEIEYLKDDLVRIEGFVRDLEYVRQSSEVPEEDKWSEAWPVEIVESEADEILDKAKSEERYHQLWRELGWALAQALEEAGTKEAEAVD